MSVKTFTTSNNQQKFLVLCWCCSFLISLSLSLSRLPSLNILNDQLTRVAEKPTRAEAEADFRVPGEDDFLTMFGMYLMTPSLLKIIEHNVAHNKRDAKGNFGITEAIDQLRRERGVNGFVVQGERFDLGTPELLKATGTSYTSKL